MSQTTHRYAPTVSTIFALIDAYAQATGRSPSGIGAEVFNDGKKYAALRDGKDISIRRAIDAWRWFDRHWPEGHEWPRDIERPSELSGETH